MSDRPSRIRVAAVAAAGVLGATAATIVGGTGDASATAEFPLRDCINISPNIVDLPYMPTRAFVSEYADTTYIQVQYGSYWIGVGYDSVSRLDWRNLSTGKHGTLVDRSWVRPPNTGVHNFDLPSSKFGPGKDKLTLSTTNSNAMWSIPARSCSGTVVAP